MDELILIEELEDELIKIQNSEEFNEDIEEDDDDISAEDHGDAYEEDYGEISEMDDDD